jgi:hypothetical protein
MTKFIKYFGGGNLYKQTQNVLEYRVTNLSDIKEKIIIFFKEYSILGVKHQDFQDFVEVAGLMEDKAHLTLDGLEKIKKIKSGMNRGRE